MTLRDLLLTRKGKLAVIGLGYVGLPLAVAFAKKVDVIGFDVNEEKINQYKAGIDPTGEVGTPALAEADMEFTCDESLLKDASFYVIAVPTPINSDKTPNLLPVESASVVVGRNLRRGSIVVYESTVYPGVTESVCASILERESGLKCGVDFKIGYSPERINPGDKINRLHNIVKVVSGMDEESLAEIAQVYEIIIEAGVYKASSIMVAEAAKVVENSQRDINIAFMNELAMVFDRMGIDSNEVIEAMNTKWNALKFYPGLVGGHCIGVDPYYFIYKAEELGYHSQIILSGRKINDCMGRFIADAAIKELVLSGRVVRDSKVAVMGITFKENCPDIRNSKVCDIIERLHEYGISPVVVDPVADEDETMREYGISLTGMDNIRNADCLIFAVAHQEFKCLSVSSLLSMLHEEGKHPGILIDVKGIFPQQMLRRHGIQVWRL